MEPGEPQVDEQEAHQHERHQLELGAVVDVDQRRPALRALHVDGEASQPDIAGQLRVLDVAGESVAGAGAERDDGGRLHFEVLGGDDLQAPAVRGVARARHGRMPDLHTAGPRNKLVDDALAQLVQRARVRRLRRCAGRRRGQLAAHLRSQREKLRHVCHQKRVADIPVELDQH